MLVWRQQPHKQIELLAEVQQRCLATNALTYSGAISACGKVQQPHEAMEFLAEVPREPGAKGQQAAQQSVLVRKPSSLIRRWCIVLMQQECLAPIAIRFSAAISVR